MLLHAKNSPIPNPNAHIIQRRLSSSSSRVCSSTNQNIVEWISSVTSDPCESRVNIETNAFGVRGLVSQKQLSPGEVIFEIPFRVLFPGRLRERVLFKLVGEDGDEVIGGESERRKVGEV